MNYRNSMIIISVSTLIAIILLFFLIILIIYKSAKLKIDINYIIASALLILLAIVISLIPFRFSIDFYMIFMTSGFFFLFLHYEALNSDRPNPRIYLVLIIILTITIISHTIYIIMIQTFITEIPTDDYYNENPNSFITGLVTLLTYIGGTMNRLMILIVVVRALTIIFKVYRNTKNREIKIEFFAIIFFLGMGVDQFISYLIPMEAREILRIIILIFSILGILTLFLNYMLHPEYLYLLPFPIYNFMVFSEAGISVYVRRLSRSENVVAEKPILLAGALTALSGIIKETLGSKTKIKTVDADPFKITFNPLPMEHGRLVVISYGYTTFFKKSLKKFTNGISHEILEKINESGTDLNELEPIMDKLIKESFPYVQFIK